PPSGGGASVAVRLPVATWMSTPPRDASYRRSERKCSRELRVPSRADPDGGVGMSERGIRSVVIAVDLFEAVSAVVGAVGLVVGFMAIPLSVLSGTPFTDFTVPVLLLGVVVGGSALAAAAVTA